MFLEKKPEPSKHCFILELPAPIVMDILRRLPLRTLLQCRFACKNWRDLVLDPHFAKLYFSKVPTCITHASKVEYFLTMFYVISSNVADMPILTRFFPETRVQIENSCNGLVCLRQYLEVEPIYIANPLTGEYLTLPSYKGINPNPDGGELVTCLMGYCPNNKLYKVVRISHFHGKADICTVGFGTWRSIDQYPIDIYIFMSGVYLNGALHWVCSLHDYKSIVTIELESERMLMLPLPPVLHDFSLNRRGWQSKLDKLRDCLSILLFESGDHSDIEIWVMKEYGVKESWSKELVIKNPNPFYDWLTFKLITTLENGDIVISSFGQFSIYDPKKGSLKSQLHHGSFGKIVPHVPSFISLREITRNSSKVLDDVEER